MRALVVMLVFVGPALACAEEPEVRVSISTSDEDGITSPGEKVRFTATVENGSGEPLSGRLVWTVNTVAFEPPETASSDLVVGAGKTATHQFELALPGAGFAEAECTFERDGQWWNPSARSRIGCDVEDIRSPLTKEADFDAFWAGSLAELGAVDPQYEVVPSPDMWTNGKIDVFEVTMRSHGDVRVRGWLEVPGAPGPHPAVIRVPGYDSSMEPEGSWQDMVVFSFNPRGHGNSQDDVPGEPADYWVRGLDDKATYFYRGAYLDCIRAVDFLASREDVDQERIAIWGGSQGGGLAFATAALDPRIDFCAADIPFLCDWVNYFKLTHWPEMDEWIAEDGRRSWESTLRTMSYFDTMNLAGRIQCPTVMGIGLQDEVCPPSTSFASFNRIPARKSYRIYEDRGHDLEEVHARWVWREMRSEFRLPEMD